MQDNVKALLADGCCGQRCLQKFVPDALTYWQTDAAAAGWTKPAAVSLPWVTKCDMPVGSAMKGNHNTAHQDLVHAQRRPGAGQRPDAAAAHLWATNLQLLYDKAPSATQQGETFTVLPPQTLKHSTAAAAADTEMTCWPFVQGCTPYCRVRGTCGWQQAWRRRSSGASSLASSRGVSLRSRPTAALPTADDASAAAGRADRALAKHSYAERNLQSSACTVSIRGCWPSRPHEQICTVQSTRFQKQPASSTWCWRL